MPDLSCSAHPIGQSLSVDSPVAVRFAAADGTTIDDAFFVPTEHILVQIFGKAWLSAATDGNALQAEATLVDAQTGAPIETTGRCTMPLSSSGRAVLRLSLLRQMQNGGKKALRIRIRLTGAGPWRNNPRHEVLYERFSPSFSI